MQKPPQTDPKTDLKTRCFWCGKILVGACGHDSDLSYCFQLQSDLKKDYLRQKRNKEKPFSINFNEL